MFKWPLRLRSIHCLSKGLASSFLFSFSGSCLLCFPSFSPLLLFFPLSRTHFSSPAPGVPFARLDAGALATQPCVIFSTMCALQFWFFNACDRAQGKPGTPQVCPVLTSQLCWSLARTRLRSRVRSSLLSPGLCLQRRRPWREVHPKWLRSFSFVVCFSHLPWWVRAGVFLILLLLLGACPLWVFCFVCLLRLILASHLVAFLCCSCTCVPCTCLVCFRPLALFPGDRSRLGLLLLSRPTRHVC